MKLTIHTKGNCNMKKLLLVLTVALAIPSFGIGRIQGSDTLYGVMTESIERSKLSGDLQYVGGGSGKGESALIDQTQGIAPMSREVSADAMTKLAAKGLKATGHVIALDGIAMFVNEKNRANLLDLDTIKKIFNCEIRKWEEISSSKVKGEIRVYRRDDASGTTDLVKHVLGIKQFGTCVQVANSAEEISQSTATELEAFGYGGLSSHVEGKNRPLSIANKVGAKGVYPTVETIRNRSYPLSRNLYLYELNQGTSDAEQDLIQNMTDRKFMDPIVQKHEFFTLN